MFMWKGVNGKHVATGEKFLSKNELISKKKFKKMVVLLLTHAPNSTNQYYLIPLLFRSRNIRVLSHGNASVYVITRQTSKIENIIWTIILFIWRLARWFWWHLIGLDEARQWYTNIPKVLFIPKFYRLSLKFTVYP